MKKGIFIALFIFSVALNVAGLSTIAWNLWIADRVSAPVSRVVAGPELSPSNVKRIRDVWGDPRRRPSEAKTDANLGEEKGIARCCGPGSQQRKVDAKDPG